MGRLLALNQKSTIYYYSLACTNARCSRANSSWSALGLGLHRRQPHSGRARALAATKIEANPSAPNRIVTVRGGATGSKDSER